MYDAFFFQCFIGPGCLGKEVMGFPQCCVKCRTSGMDLCCHNNNNNNTRLSSVPSWRAHGHDVGCDHDLEK